jgi:hypothetical protein
MQLQRSHWKFIALLAIGLLNINAVLAYFGQGISSRSYRKPTLSEDIRGTSGTASIASNTTISGAGSGVDVRVLEGVKAPTGDPAVVTAVKAAQFFTEGIAVSLWTSMKLSPHISRLALADHYWTQFFDMVSMDTFDDIPPAFKSVFHRMPYVVEAKESYLANQDGRFGQTESLSEQFPDAKWYFLADSDTIVVPEALSCFTKTLDPDVAMWKGYGSQQYMGNGNTTMLGENWWGHLSFMVGGGGILMSRRFVQDMQPHIRDCRLDRSHDGSLEDVRFGLCVYSVFHKQYGALGLRNITIRRGDNGFSKLDFKATCFRQAAEAPTKPVLSVHLKGDSEIHKFYHLLGLSRAAGEPFDWIALCSQWGETEFGKLKYNVTPALLKRRETDEFKAERECVRDFYKSPDLVKYLPLPNPKREGGYFTQGIGR